MSKVVSSLRMIAVCIALVIAVGWMLFWIAVLPMTAHAQTTAQWDTFTHASGAWTKYLYTDPASGTVCQISTRESDPTYLEAITTRGSEMHHIVIVGRKMIHNGPYNPSVVVGAANRPMVARAGSNDLFAQYCVPVAGSLPFEIRIRLRGIGHYDDISID